MKKAPSKLKAALTDFGPYKSADSPQEWLTLARSAESASRLLATHKSTTNEACLMAAQAVECAIKAYIMFSTGMNRWPPKVERPDLYEHGLEKLSLIVGVRPHLTDPVAPSWQLFLRWNINRRYNVKRMPRRVAEQVVKAAFDENEGVVPWLTKICR